MPSESATNDQQLTNVLRTLSPEQLKFVERRMYERSDADAARALGIPTSTVYSWDNKADVNEAVKLASMDGVHVAKERLHRLLGKAIDGLEIELGNKRNRMPAIQEVFDRTLGKPVQRNELSGPDGDAIDLKLDAKQHLAQLLARQAETSATQRDTTTTDG